MKRGILSVLLTLVLLLCLAIAGTASAADIVPLPVSPEGMDLRNGAFRLTVRDADQMKSGGYFTAALYVTDTYDMDQIRALAPGDTVRVSGQVLTVSEVILHEAEPEIGMDVVYEIVPAEQVYGYVIFTADGNGNASCVVDDWSPVSPVGEVRVAIPLSERFEYILYEAGDPTDPAGAAEFLEAAGEEGRFVACNTSCVFEDGVLVSVSHADYPEGPEEVPGEEPSAAQDTDTGSEIPVWKFCHGVREGLETAVITCYQVDCETGLIPAETTPEEIEVFRNLAINGVVTQKVNDTSVTGGTWVYSFETPEGEHLLSIELYKGLLVGTDGMYDYRR